MNEVTKAYVASVPDEQKTRWAYLALADFLELKDALMRLDRELPGWWWTLGLCHMSADARIGPDMTGPDADLLEIFDDGFDGSMEYPASPSEALNSAIDMALEAKSRIKQEVPRP